jgi:radical SAM protein with 4Fe4S-binding SPASM domain
MTCVDTNGDLYYCHGAMYEKNKIDFSFGNIYQHGFVNKLSNNHKKFFECNQTTPDECAKCVADSCYRCNVQKYQNSNKSEFMDRWMDFTCMKEMCNYFKLIGEIKFALMQNLTEDI